MTSHNQSYLPFRGVENDPALFPPLDISKREIRYLELQPGIGQEPIVCRLHHISLDRIADDGIYDALSYCRGSIEQTVEVTVEFPSDNINGETVWAKSPYQITKNLGEALLACRDFEHVEKLWIDAICINQSDAHEKTVQVSMMNLIYAAAKQVRIWLGPRDAFTSIFVRVIDVVGNFVKGEFPLRDLWIQCSQRVRNDRIIEKLVRQAEPFVKDFEFMSECPTRSKNQRLEAYELAIGVSQAYSRVIRFPWFSRIWVYQELLLARKGRDMYPEAILMMGNQHRQWRNFCVGVDLINMDHLKSWCAEWWNISSQKELLDSNRDFCSIWTAGCFVDDFSPSHLYEKRRKFSSIFYWTQHFSCSDPRDRLFALVHICSEEGLMRDPRTQADYTKSLQEILLDFSSAGVHLGLSVGNTFGTYISFQADSIARLPDRENQPSFSFSFYYTVAYDLSDSGQLYRPPQGVKLSSELRGKVNSFIEKCYPLEIDFSVMYHSWDKLNENDKRLENFLSDLLRALITIIRELRAAQPKDMELDYILNMLGIQSPDDIHSWRTLAFKNLSDLFEVENSVDKDEAVSFSELKLNLNLGFWKSHHRVFDSYCRFSMTKQRIEPRLFVDSNGKLLLGQGTAQVNDIVVTVEGSERFFMLSPMETHTSGDMYPIMFERMRKRYEQGYEDIEDIQTHLFLGVCTFYQGDIWAREDRKLGLPLPGYPPKLP